MAEPARAETRLSRGARGILLAAAVSLGALGLVAGAGLPGPALRQERRTGRAVRVALALAAAALLVRASRAAPERRIGLALAAVSTGITLLVVDAVLERSRSGSNYRMDAINALRRRGVRAFPAVTPRFLMDRSQALARFGARDALLPLGAPSQSVIVDCRETGDWLVYNSDEHGFHNPPGLWQQRELDLLMVGDSFTNGSCVPSERSMAGRLRERWPRLLNLGVNGNGPLLMLAGLREVLPELRPRRVLWVYYSGNDLHDIQLEKSHWMLQRYLRPGFRQDLLRRQQELDGALAAYVEDAMVRTWRQREGFLRDLLLLRALRARLAALDPWRARTAFPDFEVPEADYALFARVLEEARALTAAAGGELWFVYLPSWTEMFGSTRSRALSDERRARVRAIVGEASLPLVDLFTPFVAYGPADLFACVGCHCTETGYALAAQTIRDALERPRGQPPGTARSRNSTLSLAASASGS